VKAGTLKPAPRQPIHNIMGERVRKIERHRLPPQGPLMFLRKMFRDPKILDIS